MSRSRGQVGVCGLFFFSSRRRHTRSTRDWSSDVCSSDLSILAGVLYTGGPRPYGYEGLGELFVFLFFGLVAVNGSYYVQLEHLDWLPFGLSLSVGFLVTAILVVNNVRDLETDRRAGKRTLAVRIGRRRTRVLYAALLA